MSAAPVPLIGDDAAEQPDDMRWLALLIRQGLKLIVTGIEKKYGLDKKQEQPVA